MYGVPVDALTPSVSELDELLRADVPCEAEHDRLTRRGHSTPICGGAATYRVSYPCTPSSVLVCEPFAYAAMRAERVAPTCPEHGKVVQVSPL